MAVDNRKVCKIITDKLNWSSGSNRRARLGSAFDLITYDREYGHQGDVNYAAAEHYLFARWLIAWTGYYGWALVQGANLAYPVAKLLLPLMQLARFGNGPVTPASVEDFLWGYRGCNDGLADCDYYDAKGRPPPPSACN
jgi:hypothetical protein